MSFDPEGQQSPAPAPKKKRGLRVVVVAIVGVLVLCVVFAIASGGSDDADTPTTPVAALPPTASHEVAASPTEPLPPTATPEPSPTDTPTKTPVPTLPPTAAPTPEPVLLAGQGQTATEPVTLPVGVYRVRFTHSGSRNFIVKTFRGDDSDLVINHIGAYDGYRPLTGGDAMLLDIQADGAWTVEFVSIHNQPESVFSGTGDDVSGLFDPPDTGAWNVLHDGKRNFIVYAHCAGGSSLEQNQIGAVDGSKVIRFPKGPCFWEVRADGSWSLGQ